MHMRNNLIKVFHFYKIIKHMHIRVVHFSENINFLVNILLRIIFRKL